MDHLKILRSHRHNKNQIRIAVGLEFITIEQTSA